MKICILTQEVENQSCRNLQTALLRLGHQAEMVEFKAHRLQVTDDNTIIYDRARLDVRQFHGVIFRSWGYNSALGLRALKIFSDAGVVLDNSLESTVAASSKVLTHNLLAQAGVHQPSGVPLLLKEATHQLLQETIGVSGPFVVKRDADCRGNGVWVCEDVDEISDVVEAHLQNEKCFLLQEFIDTAHYGAPSSVYRVNVVMGAVEGVRVTYSGESADKVVNGSKPCCRNHIFAADALPEGLSELTFGTLCAMAVRAASTMQMDCCGVDLLVHGRTKQVLVLEVNGSPMLSAFDEAGCPLSQTVATQFIAKLNKCGILDTADSGPIVRRYRTLCDASTQTSVLASEIQPMLEPKPGSPTRGALSLK